MPTKHQGKCYRNIHGIQYTNYADLIMSAKENLDAIQEAKRLYKHVHLSRHKSGYIQVFVSND